VYVRRSEIPPNDPDSTQFPADDVGIPVRRMLSAHRLEWQPRPGLTIGGTEAVLYGGPQRNWEPYYLLPFVPHYSVQWNHDATHNLMVGFDAEWIAARGRRLAAEILLDDAQYSRHNEPQEIAGAASWSEVFKSLPGEPRMDLDFTRVNTYVYGQSR